MLIIKVYGAPTHMLSNTAFNRVVADWSDTISQTVAKFEALSVQESQVHVFFILCGHAPSPPPKLIVEINGSALCAATRRVALFEIEECVARAVGVLYPTVPLFATANFSDNS
jgi:hypothetical protein